MRRFTTALGIALSILIANAPASAKSPAAPLTVFASQDSGHDNIHITGHGPASTMIWLHVTGWISRDLPEIALGTGNGYQSVLTNDNGYFQTDVSLATNDWEGSLVKIDATDADHQLHAATLFHVGVPSPDVHTKTDHVKDQ